MNFPFRSKTISPPYRDPRSISVRYFLNLLIIEKRIRAVIELKVHYGPMRGEGEKTRPLLERVSLYRPAPDFFTEEDVEWVAHLQTHCKTAEKPNVFILNSEEDEALLQELLNSRRCFFSTSPLSYLRLGSPFPAQPSWSLLDEKHLRFKLTTQPRVQTIFSIVKPWYYQTRQGLVGLIHPTGSVRHISFLMSMERIPISELPDWEWESLAIPAPPEIQCSYLKEALPSPILMLTTAKPRSRPIARLFFDYDGHLLEMALPERQRSLLKTKEGLFVKITRQPQLESGYLQTLLDLGLTPFNSTIGRKQQRVLGSSQEAQQSVWQKVMQELDTLRESGWQIKINRRFNYVEPKKVRWSIHTEEFDHELRSATAKTRFKTDLFIEIDGEKLSLFPLIQQWLSSTDKEYVPRLTLKNGKEFFLPPERTEAILSTFFALFNRKPRAMTPSREFHISEEMVPLFAQLRQTLSGEDIDWHVDSALQAALDKLEQLRSPLPIPPPDGLQATLRDYQRAGFAWLQGLRQHGYNGILADDMGLGKTIQVIAHLLQEKNEGRLKHPALIVAPTTLLYTWKYEIQRFAPPLRTIIHHGSTRHHYTSELKHYDCILTSYTLLVRDRDFHIQHPYTFLILDESQKIKNATTAVARAACAMNARHRLCLTGTPIENHLGEIWSQLHFLMPGFLGSRTHFERFYRIPIERHGDQERRSQLTHWLAPFILRRTKERVALELPDKTEIVRYVQLSSQQHELYESVRMTLLPQVRDYLYQSERRYTVNVLTALLKLRQICCDPRLIAPTDYLPEHSAKLEVLIEMVQELVDEGRRILIFSQFTSMLRLIEKALEPTGLQWLKLTGRTRDRHSLIDRFQSGTIPVFLISLKAGGTGLNLTAADVVIHYDPWWNPAVEQQATDRAHRIGQMQPVFSYRLITVGTVEERIALMQEKKQSLAEDILSATRASRDLESSEWEALFAPPDEELESDFTRIESVSNRLADKVKSG